MASFGRPRVLGRAIVLLILILILAIGGLVWFDYLGILDLKSSFGPLYRVMGEGTIIELDKLAGEPVDILVNHKLIAKGEVVVIDENFGVRVTEIVSPMERMSDLS